MPVGCDSSTDSETAEAIREQTEAIYQQTDSYQRAIQNQQLMQPWPTYH